MFHQRHHQNLQMGIQTVLHHIGELSQTVHGTLLDFYLVALQGSAQGPHQFGHDGDGAIWRLLAVQEIFDNRLGNEVVGMFFFDQAVETGDQNGVVGQLPRIDAQVPLDFVVDGAMVDFARNATGIIYVSKRVSESQRYTFF